MIIIVIIFYYTFLIWIMGKLLLIILAKSNKFHCSFVKGLLKPHKTWSHNRYCFSQETAMIENFFDLVKIIL